jgi:hypothetical protein
MATKEKGDTCYDNAAPNEPIFTLRAQDELAPEIVREWAYRARKAGSPDDKVVGALNIADEMEEWQIKNSKKVPD